MAKKKVTKRSASKKRGKSTAKSKSAKVSRSTRSANTRAAKKAARQEALLAALVECGGVLTRACAAAGIDRVTVYRWVREEDAFAERYRQTMEGPVTDALVEEATRRGFHGCEEFVIYQGKPVANPETGEPLKRINYSDTLLMFLLKARRPEFRDRHEVTGRDGGPVQTEDVGGEAMLRRLYEQPDLLDQALDLRQRLMSGEEHAPE